MVSRRGGFANVRAGKEKRLIQQANARNATSVSEPLASVPSPVSIPVLNPSLVSSTISETYDPIELSLNEQPSDKPLVAHAFKKELYNVNDALSILCSVAEAEKNSDGITENMRSPSSVSPTRSSPMPIPRSTRVSNEMHSVANPHAFSSKATSFPLAKASNDIIGNGLLTFLQVNHLIDLFFHNLEPFFPFISTSIEVDEDFQRNYPMLVAVICAIASRYSSVLEIKAQENELRRFARSLIDEACVTACFLPSGKRPMSYVCETILVVLLTLEWPSTMVHGRVISLELYNQAGLVQLAMVSKIAEINGALHQNKRVCLALNMLDQVIAARGAAKPALSLSQIDPKILQQLDLHERARIGVTKLLSLAARKLYSSREATREVVASGSLWSMLDLMHPHFVKWCSDFHEIVSDDLGWESRSVMFEFNHCQLYVYSLVLTVLPPDQSAHQPSHRYAEFRHYLEIAAHAASAIIHYETREDNPVSLKLGPPMRWIVRFIHAAIFLSKSLLSPHSIWTLEQRSELSQVVAKAAHSMDEAGPENFQLLGHYTRILNQIKDQFGPTPHARKIQSADWASSRFQQPALTENSLSVEEPLYGNDFALAELDRTLSYLYGSYDDEWIMNGEIV